MKSTLTLLIAFLFLASCEVKLNTKGGNEKDETENASGNKKDDTGFASNTDDDDENTSTVKTLNDIDIKVKGDVKVFSAYLVYGDDESRVSASNKTTIGRPVKIVLNIDGGWKVEDGEIAIGASEVIETNTGELVLNSGDMFQQYTGMQPAMGNLIKLKAVITEMTKNYDHFVVNFRVWDKKGNGEITGSYKLYIE